MPARKLNLSEKSRWVGGFVSAARIYLLEGGMGASRGFPKLRIGQASRWRSGYSMCSMDLMEYSHCMVAKCVPHGTPWWLLEDPRPDRDRPRATKLCRLAWLLHCPRQLWGSFFPFLDGKIRQKLKNRTFKKPYIKVVRDSCLWDSGRWEWWGIIMGLIPPYYHDI
jgi:hypothetical protein